MGIVKKQSIQSSVVIYAGFLIGALNTLHFFPHFFTKEQFGLTRLLIEVCLTLSTLCTLGTIPVINKFFPFYQDFLHARKNDLPFLTVLISLTGYGLFVICSLLFKDLIIRKFSGNSPLFIQYFYLVYPFTFFMLAFNMLESFSWGLQKTVISNFLKETGIRIITVFLILGVILHWLNFSQFINLYGFLYAIPCIILLLYLKRTGQLFLLPGISKVTRRLYKRMLSFSGYVFSANVFNILARSIDVIFISGMSGLGNAGIFSIGLYTATVLDVPQRSMASITTPLLARAWKNKDLEQIDDLYQKSSLNLLIFGLLIFGLIWINIQNLVAFLPAGYEMVKPVMLVLGIAKLIDLGTGVNNQIIQTSKFWRFDFLCSVLLVCLTIPLNYMFIKRMGMIGSAYATLISLTTFNVIRFLFIRLRFGFFPFSYKTLVAILLAALFIFLVSFLPFCLNIYIDTVIRGSIFLLAFGGCVLGLRLSEDISQMAQGFFKKLTL